MSLPPIHKAAVLGAGTMGSRIAAHLVNAGVDVVLFDLSRELARKAVDALAVTRPPALFDDDLAVHIAAAGLDADLPQLAGCDWIIEAVAEDLGVKRKLLSAMCGFVKEDAWITTNTSGLSVAAIAETMPADFRRRWFGIHFFNPPRYMRLVEVIPTPESDPKLISLLTAFVTERLGKTIVMAKDTPNFIANRIGLFALLNALQIMQELDLSIEEVDARTGPVIGWPNTGTFRLMDLIGIDVLVYMDRNFHRRIGDERSDLQFPPFVQEMVNRKWLGSKTGQGFYRKDPVGVLDWKTLEYGAVRTISVPVVERANKVRGLQARIAYLQESGDPFYRRFLPELWSYASGRIPEIADDEASVDTAMRAGFNWQLGPFEMAGAPVEHRGPQSYSVKGTPAISLRDLGGGVAQLEFHTKMNVIDEQILDFLTETLDATSSASSDFRAFILYNDAINFSAGANLSAVLAWIAAHDWTAINRFLKAFQASTQAIKFSSRPVIAAPAGLCLGGGAEMVLHAAGRQCHAELSMGLVEASVGLIPAGGGCKEMVLRANDGKASWPEVFITLTGGQRSSSAVAARKLRLLTDEDGITMNRELLLRDAIRRIPAEYSAPMPRTSLKPCKEELQTAQQNATDYDRYIAAKLALVLGGGTSAAADLTEQDFLDLEREAFLSLCGEPQTAARIEYTLKTGKPLRN